jgi:hypothetical protein
MTYALRICTTTVQIFPAYDDLMAEVSRLGLADYEIDLIAVDEAVV